MRNKELYQKTVDILVAAYFNDTLMHGSCTACAVGNLVCANMNFETVPNKILGIDWVGRFPMWRRVFQMFDGYQRVIPENYREEMKEEIDSTGYTWPELARIEKAFELANRDKKYTEENMFNGLMAVIEVLDQIHENTDTEVTTASKKRFEKMIV